MSFYSLSMPYDKDDSLIKGAANPLAGALCLFGVFLHIILSDGLLGLIGFDYSGEEGKFYEKLHPGTLFIYIAFFVLLIGQGNPLERLLKIARYQMVPFALLFLCILIFIYMTIRSGASGIAFLLDTHFTPPMCAIIMCYTPASMCRRAAHLFVAFSVFNGLLGIAESIGKFRFFSYDPTLAFMRESTFRASAMRGHPLNNAALSAIAIYIVFAIPYSQTIKTLFLGILSISLISFGGRASLGIGLAGLMVLSSIGMIKYIMTKRLSLLQLILLLSVVLVAPLCLFGGLYLALASGMGERLLAHAFWDDSAQSRTIAFMVFDYMSTEEIIFGIGAERIIDIAYRMNLSVPLSDIENPWLLMCMYLGAVAFPIWLITTFAFIGWVIKGKPIALKLAMLAYFAIASTSNSFGRKDSTYLVTVTIILCVMGLLRTAETKQLPQQAG